MQLGARVILQRRNIRDRTPSHVTNSTTIPTPTTSRNSENLPERTTRTITEFYIFHKIVQCQSTFISSENLKLISTKKKLISKNNQFFTILEKSFFFKSNLLSNKFVRFLIFIFGFSMIFFSLKNSMYLCEILPEWIFNTRGLFI